LLVEVTAVEHVNPVRFEALWPLGKPLKLAVIVGTVPPYVMLADDAVMVRGAGLTTTDPVT
jgi:hypothetical protein